MAKAKVNIAFLDSWTESESGWGQRSDGYSMHLTEKDYTKYVEDYWSTMPDKTPHEYVRPDGCLKEVVISDKLFKQLKKAKGNMRLWDSEVHKLKKDNEILFKG